MRFKNGELYHGRQYCTNQVWAVAQDEGWVLVLVKSTSLQVIAWARPNDLLLWNHDVLGRWHLASKCPRA